MTIQKKVLAYIGRKLRCRSYGTNLERYILSRNPQHPSDVERATIEWQRKSHGGFWR